MKILHLFANWKWTGPAEPALSTAEVQSRDHDVLFVSGASADGKPSKILPHVRERGVATVEGFRLSKHERFRANRDDVRRLTGLLAEFQPDIVHAHLDNDHRIGSLAVRQARRGRLVRTVYDTEGLGGGLRVRRVVRRALDGLVVTTRSAWEGTLATYGGSSHTVSVAGVPRPLELIESGIDVARFDPARFDRAAERKRLGLRDDHVAIGIVARVQPHRRFDLLLDAHEQVARRHPHVRLVVIGRGTHIERLLLQPVQERGLSESVIATAYLEGEAYPAALAALDACIFLVPGSDGTCRALREQMSMGLAPVVSPRTPLPEIVEEGTAGLVVEESADALAEGMERLATEPTFRERLGRGAGEVARRRFSTVAQAQRVTAFYDRVLATEPR